MLTKSPTPYTVILWLEKTREMILKTMDHAISTSMFLCFLLKAWSIHSCMHSFLPASLPRKIPAKKCTLKRFVPVEGVPLACERCFKNCEKSIYEMNSNEKNGRDHPKETCLKQPCGKIPLISFAIRNWMFHWAKNKMLNKCACGPLGVKAACPKGAGLRSFSPPSIANPIFNKKISQIPWTATWSTWNIIKPRNAQIIFACIYLVWSI